LAAAGPPESLPKKNDTNILFGALVVLVIDILVYGVWVKVVDCKTDEPGTARGGLTGLLQSWGLSEILAQILAWSFFVVVFALMAYSHKKQRSPRTYRAFSPSDSQRSSRGSAAALNAQWGGPRESGAVR